MCINKIIGHRLNLKIVQNTALREDRRTETQTDTGAHTQAENKTDRQANTHTYTELEIKTDRQTVEQTNTRTGRLSDTNNHGVMDKQI